MKVEVFIIALLCAALATAQTLPTPENVLGFAIGSQPADHGRICHFLKTYDDLSDRMEVRTYGQTYEGRPLHYVLVSSEANMKKLAALQNSLADYADPRKTDAGRAAEMAKTLPAVVWLAFNIHGDELSGSDAALQLLYDLVSRHDAEVQHLLDQLIIVIDPSQNPDGRSRWLHQLEQWRTPLTNTDIQSVHHSGVWPYGRGNHYLFDMNRDYLPMVHEETQARVHTMLSWHPQLVVDVHEMGPMETYLFSPPREPLHPLINAHHKKWWAVFSHDQAAAFDEHGWRYYTRDWSESWYPGYTDAVPLFTGALGILYEQAGVDGSAVKQFDGDVLEYKESVQHQYVSALANLRTAAQHRQELLSDYYQQRRQVVQAAGRDRYKALVLSPARHPAWLRQFIKQMLLLNVEVRQAASDFTLNRAAGYYEGVQKKTFPAGTIYITMDQPQAHLVRAFCEFDPRMSSEFTTLERRELEKHGRSRIYDVTGWSLPLAFDLDAFWSEEPVQVKNSLLAVPPSGEGGFDGSSSSLAFVIDARQELLPHAMARLWRKSCVLYAAVDSFKLQGHHFSRGSVVLFKNKNSADLNEILPQLSRELAIEIVGVQTGLSQVGSDLGSGQYRLLKKPVVALLGMPPVSTNNFGEIWHGLEQKVKYPFSILDLTQLSRLDLEPYNTLLWPSLRANPADLSAMLGKSGIEKLRQWVEAGGTLIALESAAAFVADSTVKLSQVRSRSQVLAQLDGYTKAMAQRRLVERPVVDSLRLWGERWSAGDSSKAVKSAPAVNLKELQEMETWLGRFGPRGTIMRVDLDVEHWLTAGLTGRVPVLTGGAACLLAKTGVQVAGMYSEAKTLRLSGLLWPEARERWANTAYVTRESRGKGQIILFADEPTFRGYFLGSERLFWNAIFLGPGMATSPRMPQ